MFIVLKVIIKYFCKAVTKHLNTTFLFVGYYTIQKKAQ